MPAHSKNNTCRPLATARPAPVRPLPQALPTRERHPLAALLGGLLVGAALLSALAGCTPGDAGTGDAPIRNMAAWFQQPASRSAAMPDFGPLMRAQGPAVVNIVSVRPADAPELEGLPGEPTSTSVEPFTPRQDTPSEGLGSGFIIRPDGLILTNAHVVAGATSITVRLADGRREYPGRVIGADPQSDIAVLRIDADGLPVARLGSSASVVPGTWVAAIGAPFGFANTITAGIVSATGRALADGDLVSFIQSDVAVNPGSSGGPLINLRGEVVGINSMIFSPTGGYMGLSFAIPIESALEVAAELEREGTVRRGRLGVTIQPVTRELARAFGFEGEGMVVGTVENGSAAEQAGLHSGDVIIGLDGRLAGPDRLPQLIAAATPGSERKVMVWREGRRQEFTVVMGETRAEPPKATHSSAADKHLTLSEVPSEQRKRLGIAYGLRVDKAPPALADDAIRNGDVILKVGGRSFGNRHEFDRLLASTPGGYAPLLVRRGESAVYVAVEVPETAREAG